jgi:hypothetical protein
VRKQPSGRVCTLRRCTGWLGHSLVRPEVVDDLTRARHREVEGRPSGTEHGQSSNASIQHITCQRQRAAPARAVEERSGVARAREANGHKRPNITERRNAAVHELELGSTGCMREE